MKNLVLGVAKGYDWYTLEPFVNSFQKNCPSAELVLFVDDISDFTRDKLVRGGVLLESFPSEMTTGIPNNTRWKIFLDFLEVHADEYEQIFITDTRDVIFQSDVFEQFKGLSNWLGCVMESDDIRGSKFGHMVNYIWLVSCFGKDEADKLADRKTICCGTVIGSAADIKIFCREMWKILEHKTTEIFDQATMNYLVYNGLLPIENLFEIDDYDGAIFTDGLINPNKIYGGFILRGDGGIPAVVHQYDRHEGLIDIVDRIYRDKNSQVNPPFTDTRNLLEESWYLLRFDKITDATWVFLKVFFDTGDFDNYINLLMEIWKTALRKPFSRSTEILELAVQNALFSVDVQKLSVNQLILVKNLFVEAASKNHAVCLKLKFSLTNLLLRLVECALETNADHDCFLCIKWLNQLELPPDENFQRLVAEANRKFGRSR